MKKIVTKITICVFLCITVFCFSGCGNSTNNTEDPIKQGSQDNEYTVSLPAGAEGPYAVDRVVDGDTFIAIINNERVRVRALCIDTPESVAPEKTGKINTDEGLIASDRAKELLSDKSVYLEYDEERTDQYGRVLAYVYLEDGTRFEDIMVSEGLAKVVYYPPNTKYKNELFSIQDRAEENKDGFWGTGFYR